MKSKKGNGYWKDKLTPEQYRILREKGTETPFSGKFLKPEKDGTFSCVACGSQLFSSKHQHESKAPGLAGWPSFSEVVKAGAVKLVPDNSLGMNRTEVLCAKCGGHLGHLFEDELLPGGKHYCINSTCLAFNPDTQK